jgi:hypothetical protein
MDDHAQGTLSDEDIKTILPVGGVATTLETDPDTKDADGTDGTDSDDTDGTDSDDTDGTDSDGTDGDSSTTS